MEKTITIISASYRSGEHLSRLFNNLFKKAKNKDLIRFLVVDNTNGDDDRLEESFLDNLDVKIILNDGRNLQRSISHASALDVGLIQSNTEFTLIVDPDVHVFKNGWDNFCLDIFEREQKIVIGAPYPEWKLGKVHDLPSVVFMFFRTQQIQDLNLSFYPFPPLLKKIKNSFFRKITRLGFYASKNRLDKSDTLRRLSHFLERLFGITSPDTGKDIIKALRERSFKAINLEAYYSHALNFQKGNSFQYDMAREFELYFFDNEPFMTHMYGSGVFHWKTKQGSNKEYWLELINDIERDIR